MSKRSLVVFSLCLLAMASFAQTNPTGPAGLTWKKLNPQLRFAYIINKPTTTKPQEGDQVLVHMQSVHNNMVLYNSYAALKGKPAVYGVAKPLFAGDLAEAIMLITPGDSIVCEADADAIFKGTKAKKPPFIKSGDKMQYYIKLVSIKPKEVVQKEQQAMFQKMMKEQEAKQKAAAAKQMIVDDKLLKAYFAKKKLSPTKTASGLYYTIKDSSTGIKPVPGDTVVLNYTGKLMDGTTFDSNVDSAFQHVMPFQFVLGMGQVIKGWDEGVALLNTGAKATFYIPSPLAYGASARPGGGANPKGIPANSILLFDVELMSTKKPAPKEKKEEAVKPLEKTDSSALKNNDVLITPNQDPAKEN